MHLSGILLRPRRAQIERLPLSPLAPAATGQTRIIHDSI
jgi:hypothetical protein